MLKKLQITNCFKKRLKMAPKMRNKGEFKVYWGQPQT